MSLSSELIAEFVKATKDTETKKASTTTHGTTVEYNGKKYVKLDGSELLTPVETTVAISDGDRVNVAIENHKATVTGNISDPAASGNKVTAMGSKISEFEIVIADKVSTKELEAESGRIDQLVSDNIIVKEELTATKANILNIESDNVIIKETLVANKGQFEKLEADIANIDAVSTEDLDAINADIHNLEATYAEFGLATATKFEAINADILRLDTEKLSASEMDAKYANIDFSNIGQAAIENFFSESGMIKDLVVGDGTIAGELVGVTIKGDLIEGGTVVADKLVIKGEDGLYYKLNTDGETVESKQTEYNSLDGSHILANSITASKITVDDLIAFGATIGSFKIGTNSLYSGAKESVGNTTRGIYLDTDGQANIGDNNNYLKFYKDQNGAYKLEIRASSMLFSSGTSVEDAINATQNSINNLQIGTRNLLLNTKALVGSNIGGLGLTSENAYKDFTSRYYDNTSGTENFELLQFRSIYPEKLGETYTLSFYARGSGSMVTYFYGDTGYVRIIKSVNSQGRVIESSVGGNDGNSTFTLSDEWTRYWVTWTLADSGDITINKFVLFRLLAGASVHVCGCKLEKGNKATDWTPAPEDVDSDIADTKEIGEDAQATADGVRDRVAAAEADIADLIGKLSVLVTEEQMTVYRGELSGLADRLNSLSNQVGGIDALVSIINQDLGKFGEKTQYINMGTYESEPCIELGETSKDFKVLITNTRIMFKNSSDIPTYIDTDGLITDNITVNNEIRQGGFVWAERSNGNLALMWRGGNS